VNINPLDWHNTRYINHIPTHFVTVSVTSNKNNIVSILDWIEVNTVGRYAITNTIDRRDKDRLFVVNADLVIGFEVQSDATMFSLFYK